MPLPIPRDEVPAIVKIRKLSDPSAEELIGALRTAPMVPDAEELAARIAEHVPSIPTEDLIDIVNTIYALYYVREAAGVGASRFLDDLMDGIQKTRDPQLELSPDEASGLRTRFETLLSIETLRTLSKGLGLQRAGERLYCEAQILSDIRPVFGDDVSSRPVGAVVTHTLRIQYHEGEGHKEFYVVLDSEDLQAIKEVVDRAHAKAETLRGLLKDSKLPNLGL
jgi:hypothetical protein